MSATAINYHQMVCWGDIIKSNGTDYFKYFLFCRVPFEGGGHWIEFIFLSPDVWIIPIFNFHCVRMYARMHECENWKLISELSMEFSLECLFWLQFRCVCWLWKGQTQVISAVKFPSSCSPRSCTFRNNCWTFLRFLFISEVLADAEKSWIRIIQTDAFSSFSKRQHRSRSS